MRAVWLLGHRRALLSSFSSCLRLWTNKTRTGSEPGLLRTTRMMWGRLSTQRRLLFLEVSVEFFFFKVFKIWWKVKVLLIVTSFVCTPIITSCNSIWSFSQIKFDISKILMTYNRIFQPFLLNGVNRISRNSRKNVSDGNSRNSCST